MKGKLVTLGVGNDGVFVVYIIGDCAPEKTGNRFI